MIVYTSNSKNLSLAFLHVCFQLRTMPSTKVKNGTLKKARPMVDYDETGKSKDNYVKIYLILLRTYVQ